MRIKITNLLSVVGWTLLGMILFPMCMQAASFHVRRGYSDQPLSDYETCLTVTAEDITSGKILFDSDRVPVFLGDRWQLCWIHSCTIQNLIKACGLEDITTIESINLENRMIFTGEEIFDGSSRMHYIEASSAMYYEADGSLKIQDFGYDVSFWTPEELALFYDVEDIPIGSHMDSYYESGTIGRKWGEFARRASSTAVVEDYLEQGLTLFYAQLDPFDVNRPVEGIHSIYVTLKGSGTGNGDASENEGKLSNKNTNTPTQKKQNKTSTGKTATKKKTSKKINTDKTSAKKKATTKASEYTGSDNETRSGDYVPMVIQPSFSANGSVQEDVSGENDSGSEKPTENKKKADASPQNMEEDTTARTDEEPEERTPRKFTLKSESKTNKLKTAITEMEPDTKTIPLLGFCILAGVAFGLLRFRMQMKGGIS